MLEFFNNFDFLNNIGVYSTLTLIIVEVLKGFIPKRIPTAILSLIIGILVTISCLICTAGFSFNIIVEGIFTGFVTSFVSMYGFDSLKKLINRNGGDDNGNIQ